jgi:hypothetical protein
MAFLLSATCQSVTATEHSVLGISGTQFTKNGVPVFLLGFSYYGGLGASETIILGDLDDAQKFGFNWLRVWVTWAGFGDDVSAVDVDGRLRKPFMDRLQWLVAECVTGGTAVVATAGS